MSSLHYKFKSSIDYDSVTFDGMHISLGDLKKAIVQKKLGHKLGDSQAQFDLHIVNAQTQEEYKNDDSLIPKNASVVVSRIPRPGAPKPGKMWDPNRRDAGGGGGGGGGASVAVSKGVCKPAVFHFLTPSMLNLEKRSIKYYIWLSQKWAG